MMTIPVDLMPLIDRLADEMVEDWQAGHRHLAEHYLNRVPDFQREPSAALELIAEELALRGDSGDPASPSELARRFPQWKSFVTALCDCQRVLGSRLFEAAWPASGEILGEFRIIAELGRGSHSRVFLATQPALAERAVVLKVGPAGGAEHLSLARLQHTHIVPLYSVHEFPAQGLRALCLPYFGGTTLAGLLAAMPPESNRSGAEWLAALRRQEANAALTMPVQGPACAFLTKASGGEAVAWIGACLADALQFAHDRDLLHLDVKPSNVLIAADGMPMLLDFHLARQPLAFGEPAPRWLGGTTGFMPPEQIAAMQAIKDQCPIATSVDARADVFALGKLLSQALGSHRPSVALADVIARCSEPSPGDRYPSAAAVAADLRRELAALPLKGVGNRSFVERWQKWRRRKPYALPLAGTVAALAILLAGFMLHSERQVSAARTALHDGNEYLRQGRFAEAIEAFRGGELAADGWPFRRAPADELRAARNIAECGLEAKKLHEVCERVRPLYAAPSISPVQAAAVRDQCREIWSSRKTFAEVFAGHSVSDDRWRVDLLDIGILLARLTAAAPDAGLQAQHQSLAILSEAEQLLGPSVALLYEKASRSRAAGLTREADEADRLAAAMPRRTAADFLAVGRAAMDGSDWPRAAEALNESLRLDPHSLWANYYSGVCAMRRNDSTGAVAAFAACVALAPESGWCVYNRGLAFAASGQHDRAAADFDRAARLDSAFRDAALQRVNP